MLTVTLREMPVFLVLSLLSQLAAGVILQAPRSLQPDFSEHRPLPITDPPQFPFQSLLFLSYPYLCLSCRQPMHLPLLPPVCSPAERRRLLPLRQAATQQRPIRQARQPSRQAPTPAPQRVRNRFFEANWPRASLPAPCRALR